MKVVKKYTAMQIGSKTVNDTVKVNLEYGDITGPYYDQTSPKQEFDTEDEAIEYAYEHSKYSTWMIVPIVTFDNYS